MLDAVDRAVEWLRVNAVDDLSKYYKNGVTSVLGMATTGPEKASAAARRKKADYHTGRSDDRIPIVWYKPRAEYKSISYVANDGKRKRATPFAGFVITPTSTEKKPSDPTTFTFGLSATNTPPMLGDTTGGTFRLERTGSKSDGSIRKNQKRYNEVLKARDVNLKGLDGDHVRDLGYGGEDAANNYWPLDSEINQRAWGFQGYNQGYKVHYVNSDGNVMLQAIGGMYGKHFRVKGYMNESKSTKIPAETETTAAGADD